MYTPFCENMTSSKNQKYDKYYFLVVRGELTQLTRTENCVNFVRVVFEICEQTDTNTDRDTLNAVLHTTPGCKINNQNRRRCRIIGSSAALL